MSASGALRCASSRRMKQSGVSPLGLGRMRRWQAFCAALRDSVSCSPSNSDGGSGLPFPGRRGVAARYSEAPTRIFSCCTGPSVVFVGLPPRSALPMTVIACGKSAPYVYAKRSSSSSSSSIPAPLAMRPARVNSHQSRRVTEWSASARRKRAMWKKSCVSSRSSSASEHRHSVVVTVLCGGRGRGVQL